MKYLIKSLKWSKHYKKETWWGNNSNGYTDFICNAGIYTEEDKVSKAQSIKTKEVEFIPITDTLIKKGKMQIKKELEKENQYLQKERANYERTIMAIYKRIDLINFKESELNKLENLIDS